MSVVLVVVLLLAMIATTAVGCGKPNAQKDPSDTSEVVSEIVSEEVSEPVSEEASEVVSEEPVEEEMDLTPYTEDNGKFPLDLVNDMDYDEFKVIVWRTGEGAKAILSNNDSYQRQEDEWVWL